MRRGVSGAHYSIHDSVRELLRYHYSNLWRIISFRTLRIFWDRIFLPIIQTIIRTLNDHNSKAKNYKNRRVIFQVGTINPFWPGWCRRWIPPLFLLTELYTPVLPILLSKQINAILCMIASENKILYTNENKNKILCMTENKNKYFVWMKIQINIL